VSERQTIELPIQGMDCAECTRHVQGALEAIPGVEKADVLLSAEKAMVQLDPARVGWPAFGQSGLHCTRSEWAKGGAGGR